MKELIVMTLLITFPFVGASAAVKDASVAERKTLEQLLREEEVIGGTIRRAAQLGESCEIKVESLVHEADGEAHYKARVDCSIPDDEKVGVGGGIVLMLRVEGRTTGEFLNSFKILVDHAG